MVFSSVIFLCCFLPILLAGYYLVPVKFKNPILLGASIIFYAWGGPLFIFAILFTTTIDFFLVHAIFKFKSRRNFFLVLSLSINLGLLFYFKYSNFFVSNINSIFLLVGVEQKNWTQVILPIGISFYTFETITYVVDVYRGIHKPLNRFTDYLLYILFFPKLIAGPIVRFHDIENQISGRFQEDNIDNKINGLFRFFIGLSKKVLIANVLAEKADLIFQLPINDLGMVTAWAGALFYTFQIYFDFSGYSDMAIGLALLFGFKLPENFNNPYISKSITEFWRRWHISLGSWMKNYLYIPLGGNKVSNKSRWFFNLWFVFVCSGFWHGANWTFIIWGIFHGTFLVLDKLFLLKFIEKLNTNIAILFTFILTIISWVIFKSDSISNAFLYIRKMFTLNLNTDFVYYFEPKVIVITLLAIVSCFIWRSEKLFSFQNTVLFRDPSIKLSILKTFIGLVLFIICLGSIVGNNFNPFIYFRF